MTNELICFSQYCEGKGMTILFSDEIENEFAVNSCLVYIMHMKLAGTWTLGKSDM
jgi:hypothetical protein